MNLPVARRGRLPGVFGVPSGPVGLGAAEVNGGADLLDAGAMGALHDLLLHLLGLLDGLGGSLLLILGGRRLLGSRLLGHGLLGLICKTQNRRL